MNTLCEWMDESLVFCWFGVTCIISPIRSRATLFIIVIMIFLYDFFYTSPCSSCTQNNWKKYIFNLMNNRFTCVCVKNSCTCVNV